MNGVYKEGSRKSGNHRYEKATIDCFTSTTSRRHFCKLMLACPLVARVSTAAEQSANQAAPPSYTPLAAILERYRRDGGLDRPSIAAAVMKRGILIASGAVGVRKLGDAIPATVRDKYHWHSCTKAATATLAGIAIEKGKVRWRSTLAEVFPERAQKIHPNFRQVTLALLLVHRAGLAGNSSTYDENQIPPTALPTERRLAYMDSMITRPPLYAPGTRFNYSNAGYAVATSMLERVAGSPWENLLADWLFNPLGMTTAGVAWSQKDQEDVPWSHEYKNNAFLPNDWTKHTKYTYNWGLITPAGAINSSVEDCVKFLNLHIRGQSGVSRLLGAGSLAALHTPITIPPEQRKGIGLPDTKGYAMGWWVADREWAQGPAFMHRGGNGSAIFTTWVAPNIDFCMALAANCPSSLDRLADDLAKRFSDKTPSSDK